MRSLSFLFIIIIVFLAGIIFAQNKNIQLSTEGQGLLWTKPNSLEEIEKIGQEPYEEITKGETTYLENIASKAEGLTVNMFNIILHILYEVSRLFYTGLYLI